MAGRQAKKERRRAEREARAAAERRAAARRKLRGRLIAAALVAAAVGAILLGVLAGGDSGPKPVGADEQGGFEQATIPPRQVEDLGVAARQAGCELREFREEGDEHTGDRVDYDTNPPTSGAHSPQPAADGAYSPGDRPPVGEVVHALEHGRVAIQWKPGLSRQRIGQLKELFNERDGYHALLLENSTGMPYEVAAAAWTRLLGCRRFSPAVFDAVRAFRARYTDEGPEDVP